MKHAGCLCLVSVLSCAASSVGAADAAADYPNRPIRFIAPFVAGGPSDMLSQLLGQKLSDGGGRTVIVDNRGRAGALVGFELGAKGDAETGRVRRQASRLRFNARPIRRGRG